MAMRFDGGRTSSKKLGDAFGSNTPFYQAPAKAAVGSGSAGYGVLTSSPAQRSTATAPSSGGGGGGSYGGGGGGNTFVDSTPFGIAGAAPAPPMTDQDFLNSDDVYLAALSRYNKGYEDLLADVTRRDRDYATTYDNSLDDLGYIKPPADAAGAKGNWAFSNQQTAAGRGYQSILQDFAARGLLHSGDYLGAQNDFVGTLGRQLEAMNLAKQQFGEGLNQERSTGMSSRDAGIGQARAEALARYAQLYGAV